MERETYETKNMDEYAALNAIFVRVVPRDKVIVSSCASVETKSRNSHLSYTDANADVDEESMASFVVLSFQYSMPSISYNIMFM